MAKGLGLLLVFSCGALLGWGKARALEQRAGELACWQEFLRQFRTVLESTRAAPGEIVRMLARQTAFAGFQGVQALAEAFRESGMHSLSCCPVPEFRCVVLGHFNAHMQFYQLLADYADGYVSWHFVRGKRP